MKRAFRTMIFFAVMVGVMAALNQATLNRRSEGCIQLSDFYQLQEDQVDVLCIGSSHVYYGINTCLLYDGYGIASYLLASPGQPVWLSYYLLEEALKTQDPRLVVLDIGTLFRKEEDFGSNSWETLISMKPSVTKWNAIKAVNRYGELLDPVGAFFSFPYYHTRYLTLTSEDYRNTEQIRYNGYKPEFTTISEEELKKWENAREPDSGKMEVATLDLKAGSGKIGLAARDCSGKMELAAQDLKAGSGKIGLAAQDLKAGSGKEGTETQGTGADSDRGQVITERTEYYLRKFIGLCEEREILLLLVNSPFANQVEEKWEAGDYIRAIADEYGIALIEGNDCLEEMQIHFADDLLDASHLNYYGSVKYTNYLAGWMEENGGLPDRRGDGAYHRWEEMSALFWETFRRDIQLCATSRQGKSPIVSMINLQAVERKLDT